MSLPKIISFANSNQSLIKQQMSPQITQTNAPYLQKNTVSIPQLKQQMLQVITQQRKKQVFKKIHKKYSTPVSLIQSGISIPTQIQSEPDLPLGILQLQVNVTQQILGLREDKLTLMQEYNKVIQKRYAVQRQVNKMKRRKENKQVAQITQIKIFDNLNKTNTQMSNFSISAQKSPQNSSRQNENKSRRASQLTNQQKQQDQLVSQIQKLQQSSRIMQNKINLKSGYGKPSSSQKIQNIFSSSNKQLEECKNLRNLRYSMLQQLANSIENGTKRDQFYYLIDQNMELQQRCDQAQYNWSSRGSLLSLRQKVRRQKQNRQVFYEDVVRFKSQIQQLRKQNAYLKSATNQFKYY